MMKETRMAENVLFASDRPLYKEFVESAPDPICGSPPDTTITFANEAFFRAFEVERSEIPGLLFSI
jgi:PAS domain-containing protein